MLSFRADTLANYPTTVIPTATHTSTIVNLYEPKDDHLFVPKEATEDEPTSSWVKGEIYII